MFEDISAIEDAWSSNLHLFPAYDISFHNQ